MQGFCSNESLCFRQALTFECVIKKPTKWVLVYHANYFTWFEVARVELLDQLGCPYAGTWKRADYFLPVLSCRATFHSPAFFDDRLQVKVKIDKLPLVRIEASYKVLRGVS